MSSRGLQGSVLGPTLVNICIHDLEEYMKSLIKFADDPKIGGVVNTEGDSHWYRAVWIAWCKPTIYI